MLIFSCLVLSIGSQNSRAILAGVSASGAPFTFPPLIFATLGTRLGTAFPRSVQLAV